MQYKDFEKRYTNEWFSAGWIEISPANKEEIKTMAIRKDVNTLENELEALQQNIENIELKQLRLTNLSKLYE